MDTDLFLKTAGLGISLVTLLIVLYRINEASRQRSTENRIKIMAIEADIVEIKKDQTHDFDKLEKKNREDHGNLFDQNKELSKGIASIEGYLKAKKEGT